MSNNETQPEITLTDEGEVMRDGKCIANFQADGSFKVTASTYGRYNDEIAAAIEAETGRESITEMDSSPAPQAKPPKAPKEAPPENERIPNNANPALVVGSVISPLADDKEWAEANKKPMPPKQNPQFGDKTPAYVEWLKENRPDKYRERFGVTGKSGIRDVGTRKTHLSEVSYSANDVSEDESWDA